MARLEDGCEILDSKRVPITAKDRVAGPYPYYGANGIQLDSVIATTGVASLSTSRLSGSVAIVKIGNKTVKVLVKQ